MILFFSVAATVLSAIPTLMLVRNLPLFCVDLTAGMNAEAERPAVSILIPARDEENSIRQSITAALASENVTVEVVVLDDHSSDATAQIVDQLSRQDSRVRCISGEDLPAGWNGKQFACMQLFRAATTEWLLFLDADVRLNPAALSQLIIHQNATDTALLSAFPHQQTGTWLEKWLIPMMHYILLGFLPFHIMRSTTHPAYAAGCGQLFLARRIDYLTAGTHEAIKSSRHDGVKLPRAFRVAGLATDVIDGTDLAECRMYVGTAAVIRGALKNAIEGIANPRVIGLFTVLLLGASVLPVVMLILAWTDRQITSIVISAVAVAIAHLPRFICAIRFRQSWFGAACHTLAIPVFVSLQWVALLNHLTGRTIAWRGRRQ